MGMQTEHNHRTAFQPIVRHGGYLPIEGYGVIGDGATVALVGRDGAIAWLCVPRFDAEPIFCSLLDSARGGAFRLAPVDLRASRQYYLPNTGVLVTEMQSGTGVVQIIDCLTLRAGTDLHEDAAAGRGELLRTVRVLDGSVELEVDIAPRGGARIERRAGGWRLRITRHPEVDLQLQTGVALDGLPTKLRLEQGDEVWFTLRWSGGAHRHLGAEMATVLDATCNAWQRWCKDVRYEGPQEELVRRSAITLKMLDYLETGGMVAAPTSSLPECMGGVRNWDYRYAWVRDAAFAVYAFRRVGLAAEAQSFLGWVLDAVARDGHPSVMYTIDGLAPPAEREDAELEGYRCSAPVRWGNAAADQAQHDAYGEIVDCAWQWATNGGALDGVWPHLAALIEAARERWSTPDHGIWEVRTSGHVYTYSAAMCQVALDRGARIAEIAGLEGDIEGWRTEAQRIREAILEQAWDPKVQSLTEHLDGGGLDASLLALPLRRVIDPRHPKMTATVEAVARDLGAGDGLLFRYLPDQSPDGLEGDEGAFLLCSFWLVDNLAYQGRLDEAHALYESLCGRAGTLGLLPEQIDPSTGSFLGNHPQAFSHVGVISSGMNLARVEKRMREGSSR